MRHRHRGRSESEALNSPTRAAKLTQKIPKGGCSCLRNKSYWHSFIANLPLDPRIAFVPIDKVSYDFLHFFGIKLVPIEAFKYFSLQLGF